MRDEPDDQDNIRPITAVEAAVLAASLAENCGYAVFPCGPNKKPTRPEAKGGHGYKDATTDPDQIAWLWRNWPGELIGVASGAVSGFDLLDLDVKHDPALGWWQSNHHRIPPTRTFRSRSGGLHFYLIHAAGVRNSEGKLARGVDVRGDGGYAIHWFAHGCECLDHTPSASWPAWLLAELLPKPQPAPTRSLPSRRGNREERAIDGALRVVVTAAEGERNAVLHWAACRLGERVRAGQIGAGEAEGLLVAAGTTAGLIEREARATARSGLRRMD